MEKLNLSKDLETAIWFTIQEVVRFTVKNPKGVMTKNQVFDLLEEQYQNLIDIDSVVEQQVNNWFNK